jgi:hypothetical protein
MPDTADIALLISPNATRSLRGIAVKLAAEIIGFVYEHALIVD